MVKILLVYGLLYGGVCVVLLVVLAMWVVFGPHTGAITPPPQAIQNQADAQADELAKQAEPGGTVTVFSTCFVKTKIVMQPLPVCACLLGIALLVYGICTLVTYEVTGWEVMPPDATSVEKR